jgi:tetratricopeptide (TPR) repeat protein
LLAYQRVVQLEPRQWDAAYQCGLLLREAERREEALSYFNRCGECLTEILRVDALAPSDIGSGNNVGLALLNLNRPAEALQWSDKVLALDPNSVEVLFNKASALRELCRFEEASEVYDHLQTLDPDSAKSKFSRSLMQLLTGRFEAGWAGREAR